MKTVDFNEATDWTDWSLSQIVSYVVDFHHAFTRMAIARITSLMAQAASELEGHHPEFVAISRTFLRLATEMEPHMSREERVLFPYIRSLEFAAPDPLRPPPFGTVRNPVRMMMIEHDAADSLLERLKEMTRDFVPPADASPSHRALYVALGELYRDLLRHVSLENNVLFPRAIALEESRRREFVEVQAAG